MDSNYTEREQAEITKLERRYPAYMVWIVHRVYGGPVWCAKRHDGRGESINADTPDHLSSYISEAEVHLAEADGKQ
jgi:hypothetical protein